MYNPSASSLNAYRATKVRQTEDMDMERTMGVFLAHFRELLGLGNDDRQTTLPLAPSGGFLRDWELDFLYRLRALENLLLTRATLQSLAHLLSQISNIVITDEIGERVEAAVGEAGAAAAAARLGRLDAALAASQAAFAASERAFFDPSLLALLYFPEDQKYAIYIPLFLPVFIPVILSFKTMWAYFKSE